MLRHKCCHGQKQGHGQGLRLLNLLCINAAAQNIAQAIQTPAEVC